MQTLTPQIVPHFDVQRVRRDFPILRRQVNGRLLVYLDNAATSQKPQYVLDVLDDYWTTTNANIHRGVHTLSQEATRLYDLARESVRVLLNARETAEVVFTKGCTEGINLVARCCGIGPGDTILLTTMEHHSNIVPWQLVGATTVPIPISDEGEVDLDAYRRLLTEHRPKFVGIVHVSNSLGTVNPVKQMVAMAHAAGALALVDGAQAGPHTAIDVQDLDADFYALSCHKIYAPTGVGVLYGKRALLEAFPPYQGGGDMIRTVSFEKTTYADLPAKFEPGTPNIAGVVGLGAAIQYLASLGEASGVGREALGGAAKPGASVAQRLVLESAFSAIGEHESDLVQYGTELLTDIPGVRITGTAKTKAGILAFVVEGVHPHDIGTILDSDGIAIRAGHHCCMPLMKRLGVPATARASFALYTTREEVEALANGVKKVREMFS